MRRDLKWALGLVLPAALLIAMWPTARATVICSVPFTFQNNTTADATQVNSNFAALISCMANAASAGANTDITSIGGLTTPLTPAQGGTGLYIGGTSTGSANAQVVATTVPNSFTLTSGYRVTFIAGFTNTNATTLNVNGAGATAVLRKTTVGAVVLAGGELIANNPYTVVYNGTSFVIDGGTTTVGEIVHFGQSSAPAGILIANAQAVSRTQYATLFAVIGTTYGIGDGVTTFNVPDLRGRVAAMQDSVSRMTGICAGAATLGVGCGSSAYSIAQANLPGVNFSFSLAVGTGITMNAHTHALGITAVADGGANYSAVTAGSQATRAMSQASFATDTGATTSTGSLNSGTVSGTVSSGGSGTALGALDPSLIVNAGIRY